MVGAKKKYAFVGEEYILGAKLYDKPFPLLILSGIKANIGTVLSIQKLEALAQLKETEEIQKAQVSFSEFECHIHLESDYLVALETLEREFLSNANHVISLLRVVHFRFALFHKQITYSYCSWEEFYMDNTISKLWL